MWIQLNVSLVCPDLFSPRLFTHCHHIDVISLYDPLDPTAAPPHIREQAFGQTSERLSSSSSILSGLRIGVPQEYFPAELSPEVIAPVRAVIQNLKAQGATMIPVSLPSTAYALSSYYVLASAEASSNLARYDGVQLGGLSWVSLMHTPCSQCTGFPQVYTFRLLQKLT